MKVDQVFGISPEVRDNSYVDRGNLDAEMAKMLDRTTHIAIRGPSKSGKSWLRQKVLRDPITVQCRLQKPFTDIYVDALSQLEIGVTVRESKQGVFKATVSATGSFGLKLLAKFGMAASAGYDHSNGEETKPVGHDVSDLRFVAEILKASGRRLVIEDFHYMSTDDRRGFAFDLKALWDYGVFVVIIGVWSETNLLLHLNPDLTGRVTEMGIDWSRDELLHVLDKGGNSLNIVFGDEVSKKLTDLSYSNAGLLQQLTLLTLDDAKIIENDHAKPAIDLKDPNCVDNGSMVYAEQLNPFYQQFAKRVAAGMRTRNNATGIYAHAMAVIMDATDDELIKGLHARKIYERAVKRQPRIQFGNLKAILDKLSSLQIDQDGRGLILGYSSATEEVTVVDRQLLLYRRFSTVRWPWEDLIGEVEASGTGFEGE